MLVPSDRAFADLLHELKLSWDEFCGDLPRLRELLLGHVLLMPCSLTAPGESSMLRTVNQGIVHLRGAGRLQDAHGRQAQVLGQLAQQHPQAPCGYLIDRVLRPAELGLLELLAQQPEHSAFLDALRQTGASSWLSGGGPFTVLAPSNSGWATQLGAAAERRAELACPHCELGAPSERERHPLHELRALVSRHLVPGRWLSDELPWGSQLPCLGEQTLRLSPLGLMGEGAAAQTLQRGSDRVARNGVLHRVN
nr:fasciclin domain-containing protein [Roseateles sp.]